MNHYESTTKFFNVAIVKTLSYFIIINLVIGGMLYFLHIEGQQKGLFSAISAKTRTVGASMENILNKAMDYGIPLDKIKGVNEYLERKLKETNEIEYIIITDVSGEVIAQTKDTPKNHFSTFKRFALNFHPTAKDPDPFYIFSSYNIPLLIIAEKQNSSLEGFIHLGVSIKAVQSSINDIFFDIAIILFVTLVVGFEFLRFTFRNYVVIPVNDLLERINSVNAGDLSSISQLREKNPAYGCLIHLNNFLLQIGIKFAEIIKLSRTLKNKNFVSLLNEYISDIKMRVKISQDGILKTMPLTPNIENIRIVIFLVLICEGVMTTILPMYSSQFWSVNSYFSKQFISASPVLVFMMTVAAVIVIGPILLEKYNFRKAIHMGLVFFAVGFSLLAVLPEGLPVLLFTRFLSGLGFGIFYISIQNYVKTYSKPEERIKSYAIYSIANGAAYIAGLPIGGILVDNVGFFYTFLLCAVISFLSIFYSRRYISDYEGFFREKIQKNIVNPFAISKIKGVARAIILLGVPVRFLYIAFLPVFEPLFLESLGNSMSVIGRVMMIFGILMFCVAPISYKIVSLFKKPETSTVICGLFVSLALICQYFFSTAIGASISMAIFSFGIIAHVSSMMATLELLASESKEEDARGIVINMYFLYERIAMVCGPLVASLLINYAGYQNTLLIFAAFLILSNVAYYILKLTEQFNGKRESLK